jgi:hypothetical protein
MVSNKKGKEPMADEPLRNVVAAILYDQYRKDLKNFLVHTSHRVDGQECPLVYPRGLGEHQEPRWHCDVERDIAQWRDLLATPLFLLPQARQKPYYEQADALLALVCAAIEKTLSRSK